MCLGIPARVISVDTLDPVSRPARLQRADGAEIHADLAMLPGATIGDYVVTHSGLGVSLLTEDEAREATILLDEMSGGGT